VAMPCGHMAACLTCLKYYVEKNNTKCLICKQEMFNLHSIKRENNGEALVL
jgi:hypothetical protein